MAPAIDKHMPVCRSAGLQVWCGLVWVQGLHPPPAGSRVSLRAAAVWAAACMACTVGCGLALWRLHKTL